MAIAMKDLEIRGAGNLLGGEQSGHIADVGFDLYVRLVGEAVHEFQRRRPSRSSTRSGSSCRSTPTCRTTTSPASGCGWRCTSGWPRCAPTRTSTLLREEMRRPVRRAAGAGRRRCCWSRGSGPAPGRPAIGEVTIAGQVRPVRARSTLPESRVVRLQRLYPKSIVKAPVDTILVPRPQTAVVGGQPIAGIALLEWAREVIDAVIDPPASSQESAQ